MCGQLTGLGSATFSAQPERAGLARRARRVTHDRIASSSRVRNATIGRFITIRPAVRHPGQGFREVQVVDGVS